MTISVVVVEDSLVQRAHLVRTLESDGSIRVVGEATGAVEAIGLVQRLRPDVVTLDLQIPGGGGLAVIEQLMAAAPTPILVLSASIADRQSGAAVEALVAGAVDVLPKPVRWVADDEAALRAQVRLVAGVAVVRRAAARARRPVGVPRSRTAPASAPVVVAIGASTGGPAALAEVLAGVGRLPASVLVVQHLHPDFVGGLVSWMERAASMPVRLARHGEKLEEGTVLIAPGDVHLTIDLDDSVALTATPESIHRPSVDELFASLARRTAGSNVGVLLTGMGEDGAAGLLAMRQRGDVTIAQDEASSVVFGMPRAAQRLGAAMHVRPIAEIPAQIVRAVRR